jgi:branched-chain amino acid transport system permease protein
MPIIVERGSTRHYALRAARAALLVTLVLWPVLRWQKSDINQLTDAFIIATAVVGLNFLIGFTGQISIGHSAFVGIGAYTGAILVDTYGWSPGWTLPVAVVLCFVVGVAVGLPALRLSGPYLALVTLALAVAFPAILTKYESVTGGPDGIRNIRYLPPDWTGLKGRSEAHLWFYWVSLIVLVLALVVVHNLIKSRVGRSMIALRDNEAAAQIMGVNLARTKTVAFGISAAIAGLAGGISAFKLGLVSPTQFGLLLSINLLVAMVVGGPGSLWGPVFGGLLFVYGRDFATDLSETNDITGLGDIFFAVLLIAFVFVAPGGVAGVIRQLTRRVVQVVAPPMPSVEPSATDETDPESLASAAPSPVPPTNNP